MNAPDLHEIARKLQADLQYSGSGYAASAVGRGEGEMYFLVVRHGEPKARVHVSDPADLDDIVQALSWVQTEVIEYEWAAWPLCPGHPHPLNLEVIDEDIVWTCPATGATRARFGDVVAANAL